MKLNFEKVKNYNQFLLALAGTAILLFFIIGGILFIYDEFKSSQSDDYHVGILSNEETDGLQKDSLRKQIISFNRIVIIDSAEQLYLLPVTQADLDEYESSNDLLGLINTFSESDYRKFRSNYGINNNLVLTSLKNRTSKILFKSRTSISNYLVHELNEKKYIVITGNSVDSNKDKYLNSKDLQELYIYDVSLNEMSKIKSNENFTTIKVFSPNKSNTLIGQFGLDRNLNGEFERFKEPKIFHEVDLANKKLLKFIEEDQVNELQKLLEGSNSKK